MTEETLAIEAQEMSRFRRHKFMILVALTIVISLVLVGVSLWLYNSSGAAQLDLSRPGYEKAREQTISHSEFESFESNGPLDDESLNTFRELYDEQLKEATAVDPFGGDVMSDAALGIGAAATE